MKRNAVFIAVVLGYSLLELCVAFALTVPIYSPYSSRQPLVLLVFLMLIPGLAAIFSGFRFGAGLWRKRSLATVAMGAVGVPSLLAALFFYTFVLYWMFGVNVVLGASLACVLVVGTLWLLWAISRAVRRWDSRLEVSSWSAGNQGYKIRQRAIRWALWIPSLTVLAAFLFFFEVWGIASRVAIRNSGELAEYRVSIPMKWIVISHTDDAEVGASWSSGITAANVTNALNSYLTMAAPLSSWSVGTERCGWRVRSGRWSQSDRVHRTTRTIGAGAGKFTCSEVRFSDKSWPVSAEVAVSCSGPERLNADYFGRKSELSAFYKQIISGANLSFLLSIKCWVLLNTQAMRRHAQ